MIGIDLAPNKLHQFYKTRQSFTKPRATLVSDAVVNNSSFCFLFI